jgi:hypothetical protein
MAGRVAYVDTAFSLDKSSKATVSFKDDAHLAFIRKLPSAVSGRTPCEAAHIRTGSADHNKKKTGGAQKSSDCWTLPLTADEHRSQHDANELAWWRSHGIDPFDLAAKLYEVSGDVMAGTEIIRKSRTTP